MLFHTVEFWVFFLVVLALFYGLPFGLRRFLLLGASYFFYMWWEPWLASLLLFSTTVDYWVGAQIQGTEEARKRRRFLIVSITVNLGLLGFFKYFNFFVGSFAQLIGVSPESVALNIILPIGISFYTFQSMSYTIDIYRRKLEPARDFWDFALFVSFFPQLIIGPIVRATQFLPQLVTWSRPDTKMLQQGVHLILIGLIQKMVFADQFSLVADQYFVDIGSMPGALTAWSAAVAFAMQIFFDFAGYSNVARGCARLLGFDIPINFRRPYLAVSFPELWTRWHISLTSWLRDYVFFSLGSYRKGRLRGYRNLMITMVLIGVWHGAGWTFLLFGAYCGAVLVFYRLARDLRKRTWLRRVRARWLRPVGVALTFFWTVLGLVIFRCSTLADLRAVFRNLFFVQGGEWIFNPLLVVLLIVALTVSLLEEKWQLLDRLALAPAYLSVPYYAVGLLIIETLSVGERIPYVYFQF